MNIRSIGNFIKNLEHHSDVVFKVLFIVVFGLIIGMAATSKFNAHPDEFVHVKAVEYYQNHWLPPVVSDPEIRSSFSVYGHSRLSEFDFYYFLNGKFSALVDYFVDDPVFSMRLFNSFLFLIMVVLFFKESKSVKPLFLVLLISPQIWYLFSYVNTDAFGLFLSIILVYQVLKNASLFNRFLSSSSAFGHIGGAIVISGLLALQLFAKSNYYIILIFFAILLIMHFIREKDHRKMIFIKYLIIAGISILFLAPRYLYDVKLHGFDRKIIISEHKEKYADNRFKRSKLQNSTSYLGLHLKEKGVKYIDLFSEKWSWHKITFKSFSGVYGYMSVVGANSYYYLMLILYLILFGNLTFYSIYHQPFIIKQLPLYFYFLFFLIIILSSHFSWTQDFQPQGRYLFAILGVLGYWFSKFYEVNKATIFKLFIIAIALVSCYSYVFVALSDIPKI